MPRLAFFTVASVSHLARARALVASVRATYGELDFFVLLADRTALDLGALTPDLRILPVEELGLPDLLDRAFKYTPFEFAASLKPVGFEHLFDALGFDRVVYLDSDVLLLNRLDHVEQALQQGASAVLTPHITAPLDDHGLPTDQTILQTGAYNTGMLAFADLPEARAFLRWWRDKLAGACFIDLRRNLFIDQRFCDLAPSFLAGLRILRHPGYNLAYWNLMQRPVTAAPDGLRVCGEPLRFAHFSGLRVDRPDEVSWYQNRLRRGDLGDLGPLYDSYIDDLRRLDQGGKVSFSRSRYGFGRMADGTRIPPSARRVYARFRAGLPPGTDPFALPYGFFTAAANSVPAFEGLHLSRLAREIWLDREDLHPQFAIATAAGQAAFLAWLRESGYGALGVLPPFAGEEPASPEPRARETGGPAGAAVA